MARQMGAPREKPGAQSQGNRYGDKVRKDPEPKMKPADASPSNEAVAKMHKNASVDTNQTDIHHTLGPSENQASPGSHSHNGGDSVLILEGFSLGGSRSNFASMAPTLIAGLVRLGMKDNTTA